MALLFQVGGVLVAFGVASGLFAKYRGLPDRVGLSVVSVLSAVACVIAAATLWPAVDGLLQATRADAAISDQSAAVAGSSEAGVNANFLSWAAERIPPYATYYLVSSSDIGLWATYQLTPRLQVPDSSHAQWIIVYGVHGKVLPDAGQFGPAFTFAPGYEIAPRRNAG